MPACNSCQMKYRMLGPAKTIAEIQWDKNQANGHYELFDNKAAKPNSLAQRHLLTGPRKIRTYDQWVMSFGVLLCFQERWISKVKEHRPPMKNSKSNTKSPIATNFFWGILVTTYQPSFVAYLNSFSALRCNHNGHRESTYVMVNRSKSRKVLQ